VRDVLAMILEDADTGELYLVNGQVPFCYLGALTAKVVNQGGKAIVEDMDKRSGYDGEIIWSVHPIYPPHPACSCQ